MLIPNVAHGVLIVLIKVIKNKAKHIFMLVSKENYYWNESLNWLATET